MYIANIYLKFLVLNIEAKLSRFCCSPTPRPSPVISPVASGRQCSRHPEVKSAKKAAPPPRASRQRMQTTEHTKYNGNKLGY